MNQSLECPECGAIWGADEINWQQCDCCGYPDNDKDFDNNDTIEELIYGTANEEQRAFDHELYG